jgi:predicted nucleic acid-binding protein
MPTAYFDTNVYIIGILQPNSNSRLILQEIKKGNLKVIMSDYLIDEVLAWFKIHKGKDFASMMRLYMMSLPSSEVINDFEWSVFVDDWKSFVADIDDLPHICSYFAGEAEYFVTANRRLTEMKIKERVKFMSAKKFIEDVCGLDGIDTVKGI